MDRRRNDERAMMLAPTRNTADEARGGPSAAEPPSVELAQSSEGPQLRRRKRARAGAVWRAIGAKSLHLAVILFAVTFAVSAMMELLPGDPAQAILGEEATPEQVAQLRDQLNLDEPVITRYALWLTAAVQGDLGVSFRTGQPVAQTLSERFPVSFELMILVQVLALSAAMLFALLSARRPRGAIDRSSTVGSFAAISAPHFVVGIILVFIFAVQLGWLPASGYRPISEGIGANLWFLILPAIAMALEPAGVYQRLLRNDLNSTMQEPFILAAQAKGMPPSNILINQALRPSILSLITVAGINTAALMGSAVVIETLFALPGLGRLLVEAINYRDFVVIQGVVALIAVAYVIVNVVIDLLYVIVDPRLRPRHG